MERLPVVHALEDSRANTETRLFEAERPRAGSGFLENIEPSNDAGKDPNAAVINLGLEAGLKNLGNSR